MCLDVVSAHLKSCSNVWLVWLSKWFHLTEADHASPVAGAVHLDTGLQVRALAQSAVALPALYAVLRVPRRGEVVVAQTVRTVASMDILTETQ